MKSRATLPIIFLATLVFLFIQLYICKYSEPYPAIRYPAFAQIPSEASFPYNFEEVAIYVRTDKTKIPISLETMFQPVREKILLYPMFGSLKKLPDTLIVERANTYHQELSRYILDQTNEYITQDEVLQVEFVWNDYRAFALDSVQNVGVNKRRLIIY